MEGVPAEVIEDRLRRKVKKKMIQIKNELKKTFKIDIEDPKFKLEDYEIPEPRPKNPVPNLFRAQIPGMKMMGGMMMMPPPGGMMSMPPPPQGMPMPHCMVMGAPHQPQQQLATIDEVKNE